MKSIFILITFVNLYHFEIAIKVQYKAKPEGLHLILYPPSCSVDFSWFTGDSEEKNINGSLIFPHIYPNNSKIYQFTCGGVFNLNVILIIIAKGHSFEIFENENSNNGSILINSNISLKCSYTIYSPISSNKFSFKANLNLKLDNNNIKTKQTEIISDEKSDHLYQLNNLQIDGLVNINSKNYQVLLCTLTLSTNDEEIFYNEESLNLSIAYPVENVHPSKQEITIGEELRCLSDANPSAIRYSWKFISNSSKKIEPGSYENESLILSKPGIFTLQCTAFNIINNQEYNSSWKGEIRVITMDALNDMKLKQQTMKIALIAGISSGLLFIAILIISIFIINTWRKKKKVPTATLR